MDCGHGLISGGVDGDGVGDGVKGDRKLLPLHLSASQVYTQEALTPTPNSQSCVHLRTPLPLHLSSRPVGYAAEYLNRSF